MTPPVKVTVIVSVNVPKDHSVHNSRGKMSVILTPRHTDSLHDSGVSILCYLDPTEVQVGTSRRTPRYAGESRRVQHGGFV